MANVKKDKYDVLAQVIDALYDENSEVKVETVYGKDENPAIPTRAGRYIKNGPNSLNRLHARSIKVGKISMRRIPLPPTPTKNPRFMINNGCKYIVRTPEGEEAEFYQADKDFLLVWGCALSKYDMAGVLHKMQLDRIKKTFRNYLINPKLREAAEKDIVKKDGKSEFEKAKEKAKASGVSEEEFDKRLAMIKRRREHHN